MTKAALHYHFATKSDLGDALIERYAERFFAALAAVDDDRTDAVEKLRAYAKLYADVFRADRMCLCGMLAADYATLPDPMRERVVRFFDDNEVWLSRVLEEGRARRARSVRRIGATGGEDLDRRPRGRDARRAPVPRPEAVPRRRGSADRRTRRRAVVLPAGDASDGSGPPWLVRVREPDELRVERTYQQLALGVRIVELAEPHRHVPADDDRTPAGLDDDHLRAGCGPGAGTSRTPGSSSSSPSTGTYSHAGRVDPLSDVVILAVRVVELATLDVDRLAGEEVVATAVVAVQVRVDDDVDGGEVEVLLAQWPEAGIHVGEPRVQLRHAGVDQDAGIWMVDDVHADRHHFALDVQVGNEDRRDRDRCEGAHRAPSLARRSTTRCNASR